MQVKVVDVKGINDIRVTIDEVEFTADTLAGTNSITMWLSPDSADKLAFQIQTVLQDRERNKKNI